MARLCPVCGATYPDSIAFCPTDGTTLRAVDAGGDLVGTVIADRYRITELLGEGGMGKVYKAQHVRLPSLAAIKVLRKELMADAAAVARFNREASNASRVEHEVITRVFDFGETRDGQVYLAMEYIPGPTLSHLVEHEGPLSLKRTAGIIRQVADGLDAAHQKHLVHRDLKAENIMVVTDADGTDRCKIVDFGIAKAVGSDANETSLTRTGFVVGTPEFMSPEQLMGEPLDHRSDVYSLALVAYQCLTRELPFDNTTIDRGLNARLFADPRPLADCRPNAFWPPRLQAVFDQGLQRNPALRYQSAGAFAKAFEAAVAGYTTSAPRVVESATVVLPVQEPGLPPSRLTPVSVPSIAPDGPPKRPPTPAAGTVVRPNSSGAAAKVLAAAIRAESAASATPTPASAAHTAPGTPPSTAAVDSLPSSPTVGAVGGPGRLVMVGATVLVLGAAGYWLLNRPASSTPAEAPPAATAPVTDGAATGSPAGTPGGGVTGSPSGVATGAPLPSTPSAPGLPAGDARRAASAPSGPGGAANPAPATTDAAATRAPAAAGVAGFYRSAETDTIDAILNPMREDLSEADGRRAIPMLRSLLRQLPSAADSARAYLHLFEAHGLVNEYGPACAALIQANELARTMKQAEQVRRYNAGANNGKRCW